MHEMNWRSSYNTDMRASSKLGVGFKGYIQESKSNCTSHKLVWQGVDTCVSPVKACVTRIKIESIKRSKWPPNNKNQGINATKEVQLPFCLLNHCKTCTQASEGDKFFFSDQSSWSNTLQQVTWDYPFQTPPLPLKGLRTQLWQSTAAITHSYIVKITGNTYPVC